MKTVVLLCAVLFGGIAVNSAAADQDEEFLIVKYGSVYVRSSEPAKVFVDEVYKGMSNTLIENIMAGERAIRCELGEAVVSGVHMVRKNELLKLEARFGEGKLVSSAAAEEEAARKKKEQEAAQRQEQQKKKQQEAEPKRQEAEANRPEAAANKPEKTASDERHDLHLNIMKVEFKDRTAQVVGIAAKYNPRIISSFTESRNQKGKYYRTKQNLLLCEAGECSQEWTAKFSYTDETGKKDNFMVSWMQTVFTGITMSGTSSREITWCVNGVCKKALDTDKNEATVTVFLENYVLSWTKASAIFRRTDIAKELVDAGKAPPE